jgi:hypothetical protein
LITDSNLEVVEFINTETNNIDTLKGSDGSLVTNALMVNNIFFCAVGMDDPEAIFVAGGQLSGT